MDFSSDNLVAWSRYPYNTDSNCFSFPALPCISLASREARHAALHVSWSGECLDPGVQDQLGRLLACGSLLAVAVSSVLLPVLGGWLIQGALFSQAPPGRVPVLKQAISGFPVRRCRLLWFFVQPAQTGGIEASRSS